MRHFNVVKELADSRRQADILKEVKLFFDELDDILHGVFLIRELTSRTQDFIVSFGERLSAYIIAEAFKESGVEAQFLDSRLLIKTDEFFGNAKVNFVKTNKNIKEYFSSRQDLQIITGFIASTDNDQTTTLGRGGSDYTAAILGAALKATVIEIWTDVDGVMTADPRKVKGAFVIPQMSYEEAMEMSYFGAKVIYSPTMQPVLEADIPINIKNTFNPSAPGTTISGRSVDHKFIITGIIDSCSDN